MTTKPKVYLTGGEGQGWALDTDLRLANEVLENVVDLVEDESQADFIHTVCPEQICENLQYDKWKKNRRVIASFSNDPIALFEHVPELFWHAQSWYCIGQSLDAVQKLKQTGIPFVRHVPYIADQENFYTLQDSDLKILKLKEALSIPQGKYIIGSFQRDSLGQDLSKFKPQKGADAFLAIVLGLGKKIGLSKLHVLLAGPRRHWLRGQLEKYGISYTFDGKIVNTDDVPLNILPASRIQLLTHLIDVYLISSRWEGGPRALFETIACKRKILSTPVGCAADLLEPTCIYENISQAIDILEKDYKTNFLCQSIQKQYEKLLKHFSSTCVSNAWGKIYLEVAQSSHTGVPKENQKKINQQIFSQNPLSKKFLFKLSKFKKYFLPQKKITIWGEIQDGPYGGGSQFLKALSQELTLQGFKVLYNSYVESHGHILNSTWFDTDKAKTVISSSKHRAPVIHRIDGPIGLYRGQNQVLDEKIFQLNQEVATATAFQSYYSWRECLNLGFKPINPRIIRNACDPSVFYKKNTLKMKTNKKIKLISTSWSDNLRKGFPVYEWLDNTLDFSKYEYVFIGRSPIKFKNIKLVEPLPSKQLANYLREADIFIMASLLEAASNALLEAISCGLPIIYYSKSGGNSEISWFAGCCYNSADEIPALLKKIEQDYENYSICTYTQSIHEIAQSYLQALGLK